MKSTDFLKLAVAVVICECAGLLGSLFTIPSIPGWYATLMKPALAPPNWVFGPVWTTLYALMGIAAFLVWRRGGFGHATHNPATRAAARTALTVFAIQLALNVAWSLIFFGLRSPAGAFVDIALLWFLIIFTIITFYKISRPAAYLLLPYLLWVGFAAYLNFAIWVLN